ncbi:GNAT family N-acetyltransferase [Alienimonas chondri]|uniref:L-methionine sulfoximine/L-methionine sulfone acetyltransferase n=1 Tax=Alienimonas chondri TaxID=2681879 RepID=A0ABX1VAF3_9PLAN|nr:GNAT family N-acetyltransferase [Alienimonas chondri]NNJ24353.1 L-methionine sulfoximine/L-methionine sulfone acetyltransferase [Alienimonas chondri]
MNKLVTVREMTAADLEPVRLIYNSSVEHTTAVWTEETRDAAEQRAWFEEKQAAGWPILLAVDENAADPVLGYATLGPFRSQPGFCRTAEHSIHVAPAARGRGVGRSLLAALIERAEALPLWGLIGVISADNAASLALHAALGFEEVGRFPGVGLKWGRRLDAVFVQKRIG